jgi:hypothetical protein
LTNLKEKIAIYYQYGGTNESMSNIDRERNPNEPQYTAFSTLNYLLSHSNHVLGYIRRRIQFLTALESWFLAALKKQAYEGKQGWGPLGSYYEFGVGWGGTLLAYIKALSLFCRENRQNFYKYHIFGFDSFKGLPEKKGFQDDHPMYWKGAFSHSMDEINEKIRKYGINLKQGNIHFIKGLYEDSLTSELRNKLKKWPPSIVTIDVDYYSSTKIVLKWLRPILPSGSLFYFDDIWDFHGHPDYGELRAINEFNKIGKGQLVPFPMLGMAGQAYIFSRNDLEFAGKR